uniref:Uncharacterized protein n=1 Tax=Eutreptiella gymnastica TaxID=73025 RepID=A0A7S1IWK3_9EUGL|mmetsp:Transcript_49069/g.87509  ORF Transcript_49069/g.87509 Transcript_49069/m.87509 type:complete len:419 (+) Transcript_49069:72-1328(+)
MAANGFGNLKKTQERLQSILDHIDTITNVDDTKEITTRSQFETINKFKELLHTLEQLQPTTLANMPGCEELNDMRTKVQLVIDVLTNGLSQIEALGHVPGAETRLVDTPKQLTFSELLTELDDTTVFGNHPILQDKGVWKSQITGYNGKLQATPRQENKVTTTLNKDTQHHRIQLHLQPHPKGVEGPNGQQVLLKVQLKAQPSQKGKDIGQLQELEAVQTMLEQEITKLERVHQCTTIVTTTANDKDKFERTYTFISNSRAGSTVPALGEPATSVAPLQLTDTQHSAASGTLDAHQSALVGTGCTCNPPCNEQVLDLFGALRGLNGALTSPTSPSPIVGDGGQIAAALSALATGNLALCSLGAKDVGLASRTTFPISTASVLAHAFNRVDAMGYWVVLFLCTIPCVVFWYLVTQALAL